MLYSHCGRAAIGKTRPCVYAQRVTSVMFNTSWPCRLWCARLLYQGGSPGKSTGVYWSILVAIPFCSVQFSHSVMSDSLWHHESQHARPPCPSPIPGVHPTPCPLSCWCHPTISSYVVSFSSCPQSFPALGSFQMCQLFASGGQGIGVSASESVLPMNIQDWFPLGWIGWISLQSKGLSRVFSKTTVQNHQFFGAQLFYSSTLTSIYDHWKNHSLD